ncbi:MAG: sulfatase [Candidatus Levybacteria bacterium]|nr:sulfatase [Candidatus Levybacteria bacterium]
MHRLLHIFKFRLFRIVFIVLIITGGVLFYQYRQNSDDPTCRDCNLILISVDTLRPDHMGVYGYDKNTTPNIDKWAKNATVFTNMRTVVPATLPSFVALMTGKNSFETKIYNNYGIVINGKSIDGGKPIDSNIQTLGEILKINGYTTAAFLTNLALDPKLTNIGKGFSQFEFLKEDPYAEKLDKSLYTNFIRRSIPWLEQNKNKKFFLWVHLIGPHAPYSPPIDIACNFEPSSCSEISRRGMKSLEMERKSLESCQKNEIDQEKLNLFQAIYDGEIVLDDRLFGEISRKINSLGLHKKTIVIFYGDHGEGFDHNYYFIHSHVLYDSAIKIPLIATFPDGNRWTNDKLIDNTEIFPSLLEVLGLNNNSDQQNIFSKKTPINKPEAKYIISTNVNLSKYSIQDSNYKYIYSIKGKACLNNGKSDELYDLLKDPEELNNIMFQNPDEAKILKNQLFAYLQKYKLPEALDNNYNATEKGEQKIIIEKLKSMGY